MPRQPKDFSQAKIYKIVCGITGEIYVGSTTKQYLSQRLTAHRNALREWKKGRSGCMTSFTILERENYTIELIEAYPCQCWDELLSREGHWIRQLDCVNKVIPGRTKQEYLEVNKEYFREHHKKYCEANKEQLQAKKKAYLIENKEIVTEKKRLYHQANKEKLNEISHVYYQENKEELQIKMKEYQLKNKERIKEQAKKYREDNKEELKAKRKVLYDANRDAILAKARANRAAKKAQ